jgi:VWFA-related protein
MSIQKRTRRILLIFMLMRVCVPFVVQSQTGNYIIEITQMNKDGFPTIDFYVSIRSPSNDPIDGLLEHEVEVLENGTPVALDQFSNTNHEPVTAILVIDKSGSMEKAGKLDGAKSAAITFINDMRDNDETGIIVFNEQVEILQGLTSDKITLINAVNSIVAEEDTACYDAIIRAISELQSVSGKKTLVVLTDGLDNKSQSTADDAIAGSQNSLFQIVVIGLGKLGPSEKMEGINADTLKKIASLPRHFHHEPDTTDLADIYLEISKQSHHEYHITYTSPHPIRDGVKREIIVRINYGGQQFETVVGKYNPGGFLGDTQKNTFEDLSASQNRRTLFFILLGLLCLLALSPRLLGLFGSLLRGVWFGITSIRFWNEGYAATYQECPICRDEFNQSRDLRDVIVIKCPSCQSVYHRDCWNEIGGKCGSEACSYSLKREGSLAMSRTMKIYYCAVLGAIGGLLASALIESAFATTQDLYTRELVWGAAIGTLIAAFICVAEGLLSESAGQMALGTLIGATFGLIGGAVGAPAGELLFQVSGGGPLGRSIGWGLFGMMVGIAEGITVRSFQRAIYGLLGGVIGGLVGGFIFELFSTKLATQASSRAIGFIVLGALIGLFVALAPIILGQALVVVKKARKLKGREFTIDSETTYVGRDWKQCGVHLPNDKQIMPRHAIITRVGKLFYIEDLGKSGLGTIVNGRKIEGRTALADRTEIQIGDAILEFREKRRGAPSPSKPKGSVV